MSGVSDGGGFTPPSDATEVAELVQQRDFRPPPGFMDQRLEGVDGKDLSSADGGALPDTEVMLMTLRSNSAPWPEIAKYMPALRARGVSPSEIQEASGLEPSEQSSLNSAGNVFDSVQKSGTVSEEVMQYFQSSMVWPRHLNNMRKLSLEMRGRTLEYMHDQGMGADGKAIQELIRSVGSMGTRQRAAEVSVPEAFDGSLPGDCWAYRFYMNATEETRNMEKRATIARKGMEVAESPAAEKLMLALAEATEQGGEVTAEGDVRKPEEAAAASAGLELLSANLSVATVETLVLPLLQEVPAGRSIKEVLAQCAASRPSGIFGVVRSGDWDTFVPVPNFPQISECEAASALYIPDVLVVPHLRTNTKGPALLVVDQEFLKKGGIQPEGLYVVETDDAPGGWTLRAGADLGGTEPLAEAKITLRPPSASMVIASEDGEDGEGSVSFM